MFQFIGKALAAGVVRHKRVFALFIFDHAGRVDPDHSFGALRQRHHGAGKPVFGGEVIEGDSMFRVGRWIRRIGNGRGGPCHTKQPERVFHALGIAPHPENVLLKLDGLHGILASHHSRIFRRR